MNKILHYITLCITSLMIFCGCGKESDNLSPGPLADNILFTDLQPDTTVTSSRYWPYTYPVPADSMGVISMDVDLDGSMDIKAAVSHWYDFVSASNPSVNYNFTSELWSISKGDSLVSVAAKTSYYNRFAKFLKQESAIDNGSYYSDYVFIYQDGVKCGPGLVPPGGDSYLGFKLKKPDGYLYGWILFSFSSRKLYIKEFAVNRTPGNSIKAGQRN